MIGTYHTKEALLRAGYYQSGSGPTKLLIQGSCRVLAYLNYLDAWNKRSGNKLTIYHIDPCDFHWDESGQLVDCEARIRKCESNHGLLDMLKSVEIYLHEFFSYYGMFNTDPLKEKHIYQFGLKPRLDVCLPNFHDRFVLFNDQLTFDSALRDRVRVEGVTPYLFERMVSNGLAALDKFYAVCRLSSFPEFADHFGETWTRTRYFWTPNHVSKEFTLWLYRQLNDRFLNLPFDDNHWREIGDLDIFATPCTPVTKWDVEGYGLRWGCPLEPLVT